MANLARVAHSVPIMALCVPAERKIVASFVKIGIRCLLAGDSTLSDLRKSAKLAMEGGEFYSQALATLMNHDFVRRASASTKDGTAQLSPRERQIFEAMGHGQSSKEIGRRLGISIRTVEKHREHIRGKVSGAGSSDQ